VPAPGPDRRGGARRALRAARADPPRRVGPSEVRLASAANGTAADAAEVALHGRTRTIDLGRAHYRGWGGGEGESLFANIASAGMSGAIAKRANESSKALGGKASYLWATLAVFSPPPSRTG
jgi:diacylglycerol kinase family enzyme